ncbi:MAG: DUF4157 domain-containing protein [Deltaproteobacteria bacterium]|nr:DUF4157 domain-containing protein [Deltaproteobacteria bacterium]
MPDAPEPTSHAPQTPSPKPSQGGGSGSGGSTTSGGSGASAGARASVRGLPFDQGAARLAPGSREANEAADVGLAGPARGVDGATARRIARTTGRDVSHARIHDGPEARAAARRMGVRGFARGADVVVADADPHVLHHELGHVAAGDAGVSGHGGPGSEAFANAVADGAPAGRGVTLPTASGGTGLAFYSPDITPEPEPDPDPEIDPDPDPEPTSTSTLADGELEARRDRVASRVQGIKQRWKRYGRGENTAALLGELSGLDAPAIQEVIQALGPEAKEGLRAIVRALALTDVAFDRTREALALLGGVPADLRLYGAELAARKGRDTLAIFARALSADEQAELARQRPELAAADGKLDMTKAGKLTGTTSEQADKGHALDPAAIAEAERRVVAARAQDNDALAAADATSKARQDAAATDAKTPEVVDLAKRIREQIAEGKHEAALLAIDKAPAARFDGLVHALEADLLALLSGLTFDQKWNQYPHVVGRVLGARDPAKNAADALVILKLETVYTPKNPEKEKQPGKASDSATKLTPEQAYAAFRFLKALPPAHRDHLERVHPELVTKMNMSLNASMRSAADSNFFGTGAGDDKTVALLLSKLHEPALWSEATRANELEMTLAALLKAGQRAVVLEHVRGIAASAFADPRQRGAVDAAFGRKPGDGKGTPEPKDADGWVVALAAAGKLDQARDTLNHGSGVTFIGGRHGVTSALMQANRAQRREVEAERKEARDKGDKIDPKAHEKQNLLKQVFGKGETKVENLPLDQLQWAVDMFAGGGDVAFEDHGKRNGDNKDDTTNRADLGLDRNAGTLHFACPNLVLSRLRFPTGNMTVDTGRAVMTGVVIDATFPTPQSPQQAQSLSVRAAGIDIGDIFITAPGRLIGVKQIVAGGLDLDMAEASLGLGKDPDVQAALALVMKENPSRNLMSAIMQYLGNALSLGKAEGNSAGELTESLGNLAAAFMSLPPGALGNLRLALDSLDVTGVVVDATAFVDKAKVNGLEAMLDTRPSEVGVKRLQQLECQLERLEAERLALPEDGKPETTMRREQLDLRKSKLEGESRDIHDKLPRWKQLEALWQGLYEAQRAGQGAVQDPALKSALTARGASLGFAPDLSLGALSDQVAAELRSGAGAIMSVVDASVSGVKTDGVTLDHAKVAGVELAAQGHKLGKGPADGLRQELGANGQAPEDETRELRVMTSIASAEVDGLTLSGAADLDALAKVVARREELLGKPASSLLPLEVRELATIEETWAKPAGSTTYGQAVSELLGLGEEPKRPADIARKRELEAAIGKPITLERLRAESLAADLTVTSDRETTDADGTKHGSTTTEVDADMKALTGEIGGVTKSPLTVDLKAIGADATLTSRTAETSDGTKQVASESSAEAKIGKAHVQGDDLGTIDAAGVHAKGDLKETTKAGKDGTSETLASTFEGRVGTGELTHTDAAGKLSSAGTTELTLSGGKDQRTKAELGATDLRGSLGPLGDKSPDAKAIEEATQAHAAAKDEVACVQADLDEAIAAKDDAMVVTLRQRLVDAKEKLADAATALQKVDPSGLGMNGPGHVEHVKVSADLPALDKLVKGELDGPMGLRLEAGPITLPALEYRSGSMRMEAASAKVDNVAADVTANMQFVAGHGSRLASVAVDKLTMPKLSATTLKVTLPIQGQSVTIELPTADVDGLELSCFHMNGLDKAALESAEGRLDVKSLQVGLSDKLAMGLQADGKLALGGLYAQGFSNGDLNFGFGLTLDDLGLDERSAVGLVKGKSAFVEQVLARGGHISHGGKVQADGNYNRKSRELSVTTTLSDLGLRDIHYDDATTSLDVDSASLSGVSVTARAKLTEAMGFEYVYLDSIRVAELDGSGIDYSGASESEELRDGKKIIHDERKTLALKKGVLRGLSVSGLKPVGGHGQKLKLGLAAGDVQGFEATIKRDGVQLLELQANARVSEVRVEVVEGQGGKADNAAIQALIVKREGLQQELLLHPERKEAIQKKLDVIKEELGKSDHVTIDVGRVEGEIDGRAGDKGITPDKPIFGAHSAAGEGIHVESYDQGDPKAREALLAEKKALMEERESLPATAIAMARTHEIGVRIAEIDRQLARGSGVTFVTADMVEAYNLSFAQGLAYNGNGRVSALGQAQLDDVVFLQGPDGLRVDVAHAKATIDQADYHATGFMTGGKEQPITGGKDVKQLRPEPGDDKKKSGDVSDYGYTWNGGSGVPKQEIQNTDDFRTSHGTVPSTNDSPVVPHISEFASELVWKLDALRSLWGGLTLLHADGEPMVNVQFEAGKTRANLMANAQKSNPYGKAWNVVLNNIVAWGEWVQFDLAKMVEDALNADMKSPKPTPDGAPQFKELEALLTAGYPAALRVAIEEVGGYLAAADALAGVSIDDLWQNGVEEETDPALTRKTMIYPGVYMDTHPDADLQRAKTVAFAKNTNAMRWDGTLKASGPIEAIERRDPSKKVVSAQTSNTITLGGALGTGLETGVDASVSDFVYERDGTRVGLQKLQVKADAKSTLDQRWNRSTGVSVLEDAELWSHGKVDVELWKLSFSMAGAPVDPDDAAKHMKGSPVSGKDAKAERLEPKKR